MPSTGFVTDPSFLAHASPGHPERPERLSAILAHLEKQGLRRRMVDLPARDVTEDEILAVHDPRVLTRQLLIAKNGGGWADQDTYINPQSPAIALRSAGGVLRALEAVLGGETPGAFAAVRPPGHHATRHDVMGFCLLNNVAIAAAAALDQGGLRRVAIIDWDVHHGNGTQDIFNDSPEVFYASTHCFPFYPGTGRIEESGYGNAFRTKVNVPLPPGAGDRAFRSAYVDVILPALERFDPELIIVSCGWDAHERDPLAPLNVSTAGYTQVAADVVRAADELCHGRILVALEGGYDTHALSWCASALCEILLGESPTPDPEPLAPRGEPDIEPIIAHARKELGLD